MNDSIETLKQKIINSGFKLNIQTKKALVVVLVIMALFSGLKIMTAQNRSTAEINFIERMHEAKEPALMKNILRTCSGDISNSEVFLLCANEYKAEQLAPFKSKLKKQVIQGYLWIAAWGGFLLIVVLLAAQPKNKQYAFEIIGALWDRLIVDNARNLINKFRR